MIAFWLIAAGLSVVAAVILLRPLSGRLRSEDSDRALAVYRDQLAEIARDQERGLLEAEEAAAAEREVKRRMISASETTPGEPARLVPRWAQAVVVVCVPALGLALYLSQGNPDLPALPIAERPATLMQERAAIRAEIAELSRTIRDNPQALRPYLALADAHIALQQYRAAVTPLEQAVMLTDRAPPLVYALAETLIRANDETVGERARELLDEVVEKVPNDPRARYLLAVADEQQGRADIALGKMQGILRDLPASSDMRPLLIARIAELSEQTGIPVPPPPAMPALDEETVSAAQDMSAEDREAMIDGMVASLAARLEEQPDDVEGWLRLTRSYQVLGRQEDFIAAAERAVALAPADPQAIYFGAMAAEVDGRYETAIARLEDLLARLPKDAPIIDAVRDNIAALRAEL